MVRSLMTKEYNFENSTISDLGDPSPLDDLGILRTRWMRSAGSRTGPPSPFQNYMRLMFSLAATPVELTLPPLTTDVLQLPLEIFDDSRAGRGHRAQSRARRARAVRALRNLLVLGLNFLHDHRRRAGASFCAGASSQGSPVSSRLSDWGLSSQRTQTRKVQLAVVVVVAAQELASGSLGPRSDWAGHASSLLGATSWSLRARDVRPRERERSSQRRGLGQCVVGSAEVLLEHRGVLQPGS